MLSRNLPQNLVKPTLNTTTCAKTVILYRSVCQQIVFKDPLNNRSLLQAVIKSINVHGIKSNLEKFEIPKMVTLVPEAWTPESGLVTAAFKLKRKMIQSFFQQDIEQMYKNMI